MKKSFAILAAAGLAIAAPAIAHVTVTPPHVDKQANVTATFSFSHGCNKAATTALRVTLPDGVTNVQPAAVRGWTASNSRGVVEWKGGSIADGQKGEFKLSFKAPNAGMMLYFPTDQVCGRTITKWDQIPAPGADGKGLQRPAPAIHVGPMAPGHDMSQHQH